jgi:uncharacterized protein YabN with tetrapyrrole methylase and pyrophosphatase domain
MRPKGSLTIVGSGIRLNHLTIESMDAIEEADKLLYLVVDPMTATWILKQRPDAECLQDCYAPGKDRMTSYMEMVERIMSAVRSQKNVCAVYYGHPAVLVTSSHRAVTIAREEGYKVRMLPAISSEDCLFSDLGIDPLRGCQTFEATDFLLYERRFDPTCSLILYQVGIIADFTCNPDKRQHPGLKILIDRLLTEYDSDHPVVLYEASSLPRAEPNIHRCSLSDIDASLLKVVTTLYIYPKEQRPVSSEMKAKLGIA